MIDRPFPECLRRRTYYSKSSHLDEQREYVESFSQWRGFLDGQTDSQSVHSLDIASNGDNLICISPAPGARWANPVHVSQLKRSLAGLWENRIFRSCDDISGLCIEQQSARPTSSQRDLVRSVRLLPSVEQCCHRRALSDQFDAVCRRGVWAWREGAWVDECGGSMYGKVEVRTGWEERREQ